MMKNILNITLIAVLTLLFGSCEYDRDDFISANSNVSFTVTSSSINEYSTDTIKVPLVLAGIGGSESVTVEIGVDTESSSAVEGIDFVIESGTSYTFSDGAGILYVEISVVDNDEFTGDLDIVLQIESSSVDLAENTSTSSTISIVDDEHPLKSYLGTYTVSLVSYWSGDTSFDIEVTTDEDDLTKLWVSNWYFPYYGITAPEAFYIIVDEDAGEITWPSGQSIGDPSYGETALYMWDFTTDDSSTEDMIGTIGSDYSITMSSDYGVAGVIIDGSNEGYWVGAQYSSVWTKK